MAAALAQQFVWITPLWVDFFLVFAGGLLAWALIGFVRRPLTVFLLLLGITVVYLVVALIAYDWVGLLLVTVPVLTVFLLSGLFSLGYDHRVGRIEKLRTRQPTKDLGFENLVAELIESPLQQTIHSPPPDCAHEPFPFVKAPPKAEFARLAVAEPRRDLPMFAALGVVCTSTLPRSVASQPSDPSLARDECRDGSRSSLGSVLS